MAYEPFLSFSAMLATLPSTAVKTTTISTTIAVNSTVLEPQPTIELGKMVGRGMEPNSLVH